MEFVEKTVEEIEKMKTEEQIKYFNELNADRAKKLENLKTQLKTENKESIEKAINDLKEEVQKSNLEQFQTLTKSLERQGEAINKLLAKEVSGNVNKLGDILREKSTEIKEAGNKPVSFIIEKTDVLTSSVGSSTIAMRDPNIGQIARPLNVLRPLFATGVISEGMGGVVRYIDQATNTNNAAMQTEGELKGEGAITWVERNLPIETVAEWIPVSKQALADFNFIEGEIRNKLLRDLAYKVDGELWDGTGTAPELKGVYTSADTYTATASGITDASIYDLIVKVSEDISGDTTYMPNVAVMNIADINKMRLKKDANNNYVLPPFASVDGSQVAGITVVASSQVTANTMLIGDFNYATLYSLGNIEITIGWQNQQFVKNMVTILAEERLGLLVKNVETDAFRKVTDIDSALATLAQAS